MVSGWNKAETKTMLPVNLTDNQGLGDGENAQPSMARMSQRCQEVQARTRFPPLPTTLWATARLLLDGPPVPGDLAGQGGQCRDGRVRCWLRFHSSKRAGKDIRTKVHIGERHKNAITVWPVHTIPVLR
jgi:hypothetical protein